MASSDFPKLVVCSNADHNGQGHWEARRKEDYNRKHAKQAAHAYMQGNTQTGLGYTRDQINTNFNDFLRFCKLDGDGGVAKVMGKEGINRPSDFDNYSFAELVDAGLKPDQVKEIKDARVKANGGQEGYSHPVYGADAFYNTSKLDVRATARAPRSGRQDFVSMGRVDTQMMTKHVWGPHRTPAGFNPTAHQSGVPSNAFLATQPGSPSQHAV